MFARSLTVFWQIVSFLLITAGATLAHADSSNYNKVVDGVAIYIGVVPGEIIRGHPKEHPEGAMHGGVGSTGSTYHLMVALFDAKTGDRITDAEVRARGTPVGMSTEDKKLETMTIADAVTYGNFFVMSGSGPFRIALQIRRPNAPRTIEAQFE